MGMKERIKRKKSEEAKENEENLNQFIFVYELTNDFGLLLTSSPLSETLTTSFSLINMIEAVSFTGANTYDAS